MEVCYQLAYVSWFEIREQDNVTGLYVLKRTQKCSVICINEIERPIHLIPKFGHQAGNNYHIKRQIEQDPKILILSDSRAESADCRRFNGSDSNCNNNSSN